MAIFANIHHPSKEIGLCISCFWGQFRLNKLARLWVKKVWAPFFLLAVTFLTNENKQSQWLTILRWRVTWYSIFNIFYIFFRLIKQQFHCCRCFGPSSLMIFFFSNTLSCCRSCTKFSIIWDPSLGISMYFVGFGSIKESIYIFSWDKEDRIFIGKVL